MIKMILVFTSKRWQLRWRFIAGKVVFVCGEIANH
jgi:hypothetical protein